MTQYEIAQMGLKQGSLRHHLRQRTASLHARLDALVPPFASLDLYKTYLIDLLAFREPVDLALSSMDFPHSFGSWRPSLIAASIRQDMIDLEMKVPEALPARPDLTELTADSSTLLGILYVVEGASVGASLLAKRAASLGLSPSFGARHLALQTGDKKSWKSFLRLLTDIQGIDAESAANASILLFGDAVRAFDPATRLYSGLQPLG